jgi:hypothetical protein
MERRDKTWRDFGAMPLVAPTAKRVGVAGWAYAGAALGALSGAAALAALWRPLPGLEAPPGDLATHVGLSLRWLVHQAWAPAFASDARGYASGLARLRPSAMRALEWRACAAGVAACVPAALLAPMMLRARDSLTVLRGPMRLEGERAAKELRRLLAKRCAARPDHDLAPGVPYSADMWTRHMLLVGGVGSGKSTALKPLIAKVVAANERALIFDPKGEFTKGFAKPIILAPWDARSHAWDVARDMRNIGDMRRLAAALVKDAHDPMWSNAARQLLVGFMAYLKATRRDDWGWGELSRLSSAPQTDILPMMEAHHPEAVRAVERASVTTQGILINLASFLSPVHDLAEAWGSLPKNRRVSFVDWTHGRDKRSQIILQGHGAYPDLTKSMLEGVVGTVAAIVNSVEMDDDPSRKIWFIADESAQMGKIPMRPLFDVGRSRGVRCVIACQDLGQLEEIHGDKTVKAIVSMAGSILLGQLMPGETSEQICKALGSREVERANVSASVGAGSGRSTTLSFSRDELSLYKPSELASRLGLTADGLGVRMALCMAGNAYELFWPHHQMREARPAHAPAPWTRRFAFDDEVNALAELPSSEGHACSDREASSSDEPLAPDEAEALSDLVGLDPDDGYLVTDDGEVIGRAPAQGDGSGQRATDGESGRDAARRGIASAGIDQGSPSDPLGAPSMPSVKEIEELLRQVGDRDKADMAFSSGAARWALAFESQSLAASTSASPAPTSPAAAMEPGKPTAGPVAASPPRAPRRPPPPSQPPRREAKTTSRPAKSVAEKTASNHVSSQPLFARVRALLRRLAWRARS